MVGNDTVAGWPVGKNCLFSIGKVVDGRGLIFKFIVLMENKDKYHHIPGSL